jgi:uncharacterized protein YutE (UPF0331/DUF86 family)
MSREAIYWLFSSSAQAVAAFIAFLLAGFALVLNLLDTREAADESLAEIHTVLRRRHYRDLRAFSGVTGLAIITSLIIIALNGSTISYSRGLLAIGGILNVVSILGGLLFILTLIDPDRYERTARAMLQQDAQRLRLTGELVDETDFLRHFIPLERLVRLAVESILDIPSGQGPRYLSFPRLIDALFRAGVIDQDLRHVLLDLGRYRNLVVHGHVGQVDRTMVDRARQALERLESFYDSRRRT